MKKRAKDIGVGDVVVLKCGGAPMVVATIVSGQATCYWQVNSQHPFISGIPLDCLTIYED